MEARWEETLGNETDIILNYNLNRFTNIEMGYAMMFAQQQYGICQRAGCYRCCGRHLQKNRCLVLCHA